MPLTKFITSNLFALASIPPKKYLLKENIKAPREKPVKNINEILRKKVANIHSALLEKVKAYSN